MSGKTILKLILAVFVLEIVLLVFAGDFGSKAGNAPETWFSMGPLTVNRYGLRLEVMESTQKWNLDGSPKDHPTFWSIDLTTARMILLVDSILLFGSFLAALTLRRIPGRLQGFMEIALEFFRGITRETLGRHADRHVPTILTLFFFIWFSNLIGVIPLLSEPTKDLNVALGQMVVMILLVHYESIRVKGLKTYLKEYFEPIFILFPLNIVGEFAKGISLSFRLFGNIFGGSIIILVISYLFRYTIMPVGLNLFFGIFVGTVQAFVFTMLSLTYIAVAVTE